MFSISIESRTISKQDSNGIGPEKSSTFLSPRKFPREIPPRDKRAEAAGPRTRGWNRSCRFFHSSFSSMVADQIFPASRAQIERPVHAYIHRYTYELSAFTRLFTICTSVSRFSLEINASKMPSNVARCRASERSGQPRRPRSRRCSRIVKRFDFEAKRGEVKSRETRNCLCFFLFSLSKNIPP